MPLFCFKLPSYIFCRYVGTQAIQFIRAKGQSPTISTIAHSSYMDIFQNLAVDMDTEGRYGIIKDFTNLINFNNILYQGTCSSIVSPTS